MSGYAALQQQLEEAGKPGQIQLAPPGEAGGPPCAAAWIFDRRVKGTTHLIILKAKASRQPSLWPLHYILGAHMTNLFICGYT